MEISIKAAHILLKAIELCFISAPGKLNRPGRLKLPLIA